MFSANYQLHWLSIQRSSEHERCTKWCPGSYEERGRSLPVYLFRAIWEFAQSRDCALGLRNLKVARHQCAILRSCVTGAQSRDSTVSVVCTIEPFEFPSYIRVRDVRNKLLQLRRHLQCRACILKPLHQGLLGCSPTRRNSLPLCLGSREIPDLWSAPVQGNTISESSQLSSVSQLGRSHPVSPLRQRSKVHLCSAHTGIHMST